MSTHSTSSDDNAELPMNIHTLHLNTADCGLKFQQMKNSDFGWIYGIFIYLAETQLNSNTSLGPINMQNVQHLLNPEMMPTNASKLLSMLSQKKSHSIPNDILDSIKAIQNAKLGDDLNSSQVLNNSLKQFQNRIDDKLDNMSLHLHAIENQMDSLNKKFNTLLNVLVHDYNVVPKVD